MRSVPTAETESLVNVHTGDVIEVVSTSDRERIHGRSYHYLRPGGRWVCRVVGSATILLTNDTGRTMSIPCDLARYIQVRCDRENEDLASDT